MPNLLSRRSGLFATALVALAAAIIGCGGGGGGGGGSTGVTSSASAGTDSTTTAGTLTNGGSGGTNGAAGGQLIPDTIYYPTYNSTDYDIKYTKANGAGTGTFASGVPSEMSAAAPDPSTAGRFAFAAIPSGGSKYGIYVGTNPANPAAAGTIAIVTPRYARVSEIQIARDGSKVVWVASTTTLGTRQLYEAPVSTGAAIVSIGAADSASLSPAGDRVVFASTPDGELDTELYIRVFAETTNHRLTQNDVFDLDPQFNHDGTKVVFSQAVSSVDGSRFKLATIDVTGTTIPTPAVIDPSPSLDQQAVPTLNNTETKIAYVGIGSAAGATGLYVADYPSGANATKVLSDDNIGYGAYWTNSVGRGFDRVPLSLSVRKR